MRAKVTRTTGTHPIARRRTERADRVVRTGKGQDG